MRIFLGLPVPRDVVHALNQSWEHVTSCPLGIRWTDPRDWHATIAFLGEIDERRFPQLVTMIQRAIENPPSGGFSLNSFEAFPLKNPRSMVARVSPKQSPTWHAYVERIRDMVSVVTPQVDRKPWVPHITLGRAKKGHVLAPWQEPFSPVAWIPNEMTLVQSELFPEGPRYTNLHAFTLHV